MKTAASSGGIGDIIYAVPIMKELGVTDLYVKESYYFVPYGNMYLAVKDLIEMQGFRVHSTSGAYPPGRFDPALKIDVNLDDFRKQPKRGLNHIMTSYANQFGSPNKEPYKTPWLNVETAYGEIQESYTLIAMTGRWRDQSPIRWHKVVEQIGGKVYFIGFKDEYANFLMLLNQDYIPHWQTQNMLHVARLIKDCKALYCNQTAALTIAQGLGKNYYLEVKPGKTNTLTRTPNEHILRVAR